MNLFDRFHSPSPACFPKLIWVWNQVLSVSQRIASLAEFHRQGFRGIVAVPGTELPQIFPSENWTTLAVHCQQEATRLGNWFDWIAAEESWDFETRLQQAWFHILERQAIPHTSECEERVRRWIGTLMTFDWTYNPVEAKHLYEMQLVAEGTDYAIPAIVLDSIEGTRKEVCPALHGPCQPWWPFQQRLSQRWARLAAVLSQGVRVKPITIPEGSPAHYESEHPEAGRGTLLFHERHLEEGRILCVANPSRVAVRAWRLQLDRGDAAFLGDPDTGQWSRPIPIPNESPIPSTPEKSDELANVPSEIAGHHYLDFNLTPGTVAAIWIPKTIPPPLTEVQSRRGAKVVASLDLPDRYHIEMDRPAYLPLRQWTLAVGMNREHSKHSIARTEFQVCDCPERIHLVIDGWGDHSETHCPPSGSEIWLNGTRIHSYSVSPWIDPFFRCADITALMRPGHNCLEWIHTTGCRPDSSFIRHPWYLAGDFALQWFDDRWVLVEPRTQMGLGDWAEWGYPFYSGTVRYHCHLNVPETFRQRRIQMELTALAGSAEISVDGEKQGTILWRPYVLDVPALHHPGPHHIEIAISNSLANLFYSHPHPSGLLSTVHITAQ